MGINLNTLAVAETTVVHLTDANDNKLYFNDEPVTITIYGKGSKQFKQALSELNRKSLQRKGKPQNLAVIMDDNVDYLVAITKEASNVDNPDGTPATSEDDFKALYSNPKLFFIKDTIQAALDDNSNFTQK